MTVSSKPYCMTEIPNSPDPNADHGMSYTILPMNICESTTVTEQLSVRQFPPSLRKLLKSQDILKEVKTFHSAGRFF